MVRVVDTEIMNIEIAGRIGQTRYVQRVIALVVLAEVEAIFEAPQLLERAHPQRALVGDKAHAAIECSLEHR